ncbi:ArsR/SmtB family transcription factor [Paramicrobacterium agarici]|uniref:ArsR/SmtB family transcription factor n=1 Tax=Paramicrobacterium agarici TaxID=630514 RepID=UPI001152F2A1|nr:metalloregulator ArsR/SmtB family transcription factor [Microbacterium agarici]
MTLTASQQAPDVAECDPATQATECCSLSQGPLDAALAQRVAVLLKALSDPIRLRLLSHIAAQGYDTVCVCNLTDDLGISQPTVSHHMKKLVDAGLVTREQRGKWAHYTLVPSAFAELRKILDIS